MSRFGKNIKARLYQLISDRYMAGCSHYNTLAVRRASRSKAQARKVFAHNNLPCAKGIVFFNPARAFAFAKQHGFPVVVKPNVSGYSRGSYFPINSRSELLKAIILARLWWPYSIIEQYLKGRNYRVVASKNKLGSVIRRFPAFVTGNGTSSISELIDKENEIRKQMQLYPIMYPIKKDRMVIKHLEKQKLTLESIPRQNQPVELFYRLALAPGGVVEIVDQSTIHPDNRDMFIKIVNLFDANILGIDVIFEQDIETSHKQQKSILIEVNSRPYLKMHDAPRYGQAEDLSDFYAELDALDIKDKDTF